MNLNITSDINTDLSEFEETLNLYIEKLTATENQFELKTYISLEFNKLVQSFINLGNCATENQPNSHIYHVNYILAEDFKTVMVLHRDVFLELTKAAIFNQEKQLNELQLTNHFEESKTIIENKLADFYKTFTPKKVADYNKKRALEKINNTINLQKNPWSVYKSQYKIIENQIQEIAHQKGLVFNAIETFNELKKVITNLTNEHDLLVHKIIDNLSLISKKTQNQVDHTLLLNNVEDQLTQQSLFENKQYTFSDAVNYHINLLQKINMPISTEDGLLSIREIDLKKSTQKWFDYQILPEYMDLIGLETNLINKYNSNLINLKNRLQVAKERQEEVKYNSLIETLSYVEKDINEIKSRSKIISDTLNDKIKNDFLLSNFIAGKPFLEVSLNSSLNVESSTFFKKIKEKIQKGASYFNSQYKKSLHLESLSNIELSTQCIAHRMFRDENYHYDSLFLNKKFIGDLFLVPRKNQEEKLKVIVDHWHKGFNKSVLVTGERLSGKSTFLDYSAKKLFGNHIVTLMPNSTATIDGRKFKTTNDLKEALSYVKNNNIKSTKPIILIDDLELWRDAKHSFLSNIRALLNFIETESDNAFVMASTNLMMVKHLDNRFNFSNVFSHVINVSTADENEIINAILLRHGAAHNEMVSKDLEIVSNSKISSLALDLSKQNNYNLGNTLQSWTYNTFAQENQSIVYRNTYFEFLDFFTSQEIIILKQALTFSFISEYGIKNVTTTSFDTEFKSALRRLINVKILMRHINGYLYINPVIINDVSRIINNKVNL